MCRSDFVGLYSTFQALYLSSLNNNKLITFSSSSFFSRSPSMVDLSHHRFLSILGLFPVTFSVFVFILLRFDSQSSLSQITDVTQMQVCYAENLWDEKIEEYDFGGLVLANIEAAFSSG